MRLGPIQRAGAALLGRESRLRGVVSPLRFVRPIRRMLLPLRLRHLVRRVVQERLGSRPGHVRLLACNVKHWVFEVTLRGEQAVIVKTSPQREGRLLVEAWAHRRLSELGVPVAAVLAVEGRHPSVLGAYLITTRCPGVPLSKVELDGGKRQRALIDAGRHLRSIHGVVLSGFGPVDERRLSSEGLATGCHASWREALQYWLEPLPMLQDRGLLDLRKVRRVEAVLQRFAYLLEADRSVLLHGGFEQDHVFVDAETGRVSGVIDLEAKIGDPLWDLACFRAHSTDPADSDALLRAYETSAEWCDDMRRKIAFYVVVRSIGSAAWWLERGFIDKAKARLQLVDSELPGLEAA